VLDTGFIWAMDGCLVYGGTNLPPMGQANCPPPPYTSRTSAFFPAQQVVRPTSGVTYPTSSPPGTTFTCNSTTGSNSLKSGATYYYTTVTLAAGCGIDPTTLPGASVK